MALRQPQRQGAKAKGMGPHAVFQPQTLRIWSILHIEVVSKAFYLKSYIDNSQLKWLKGTGPIYIVCGSF